ncbi:MAG: hypothetical protein D6761_10560 [Candidatus Dadabacteria bacterium]|nr:MAG: hypothetical protein D6761_10560 [Candidatus Dadabacteria bacterium]
MKRFYELELILYLVLLMAVALGIYGLGLAPDIWFQARQDPTYIIFTIMAMFVAGSLWVIGEMIRLLGQHGAVSRIVPHLKDVMSLQLGPKEQKTLFGQILIGLQTAHQINPLHDIDYRTEIAEVCSSVDARHANIRFIARVMQFLGVLGTMLGLIIALGVLYRDLSAAQADLQNQIVAAIKNSMSGMYAAYATSVAGLFFGSIVLTYGTTLLANALERFELRVSSICRRIVAPQLAAAAPGEAAAGGAELATRQLQQLLELYRALHDGTTKQLQVADAQLRQQQELNARSAAIAAQLERVAETLQPLATAAGRLTGNAK